MMTFREIFLSPVGGFGRQEEFDAAGVSLIDNTPKEIADVILEMEGRLNGSWIENEEDDNLQRQFWGIIAHTGRYTFGRIGAQFLRDYRELLT